MSSINKINYKGIEYDFEDLIARNSMFSGDYGDLTNKPIIPTKMSDLNNDVNLVDKSTVESLSKSKISEPPTEGNAGQVLSTDGNGGRSWVTASASSSGMNRDEIIALLTELGLLGSVEPQTSKIVGTAKVGSAKVG